MSELDEQIEKRVDEIIDKLSPIDKVAMAKIPHYAEALRSGIRIGYSKGAADALKNTTEQLESLLN